MISTIFIDNITVVDYAYISNTGEIEGNSFNLSCEVSGHTDNDEQVVIDFSTLKKTIKELIDGADGFDHKLWILDGYSQSIVKTDGTNTYIHTPSVNMTLPNNAVKMLYCKNLGELWKEMANIAILNIDEFLQTNLFMLYPNLDLEVTCSLSSNTSRDAIFTFHYSHGLKNSTSYGCQNIAHGHESFIDFYFDSYKVVNYGELEKTVNDFNKTYFAWKENVIDETSDELEIGYETPRGKFSIIFQKSKNKIVIMERETTIENLIRYYVDKNRDVLDKNGVTRVYMSEGLDKGSILRV